MGRLGGQVVAFGEMLLFEGNPTVAESVITRFASNSLRGTLMLNLGITDSAKT